MKGFDGVKRINYYKEEMIRANNQSNFYQLDAIAHKEFVRINFGFVTDAISARV